MSIITSHEISRFYEEYQQTEVTFNKQVMEATGLLSTHLKAAGSETRSVLYSTSTSAAKLLVPAPPPGGSPSGVPTSPIPSPSTWPGA